MAWSPDRSEWLPPSLCSTGLETLFALGAGTAAAGAVPEAAALLAAPSLAAGAGTATALAPAALAAIPAGAVAGTTAAGTGLGLGTALPLAGTAIGAGTSLLGTMQSSAAARQQNEAAATAARLKAAADRAQANTEAGYAQRQALTDRRKEELVLSRSRALAAAGGGYATDPSTLTTEGDIAAQGEYNALSNLAAGRTKEQALLYQSDIDLYNAGRYGRAAGTAASAQLYSGLGSLASGLSTNKVLFPRYGDRTYGYS